MDNFNDATTEELLAAKASIERSLDTINAVLRARAAREKPAEIKTAEYCDRPRNKWMGGV